MYCGPQTPGGEVLVRSPSRRSLRSHPTVSLARFLRSRSVKEPPVSVGDPRFDGWETVSTLGDTRTALAWRDQLRALGLDAACLADYPPDRFGRGEIYLAVPSGQWSRANEIVDGLE